MRPEVALLALLGLAGCAALPGRGVERAPVPAVPSSEAIQAAQLGSYLQMLQTLVQGSPAEQAEVMDAARQGYDQARLGPAALRYGLVLAAPAHPARDPRQAQRLLREALARPELLSGVERSLALVELERVEAELRLSSENARLVGDAQLERERQQAVPPSQVGLTRRVQTLEQENARLTRALEEANAKLKALADIERERSISDRPPAAEGRKP